ncbi:uncharacterized protein [Nicotiana sylvestris]|uniref:uncharacterized protein n=1 Tax=Nicotiana sylvestris TaxID=4096 RepID=UPI00388C4FD0
MTIFHDKIHNEIEVYVENVIIRSKRATYHIADLRKFFDRLQRYNLKLNPAKCAFGVLVGKLLGLIVSHRGIELDPSKWKVIQELPPPKSKKDMMSFLGHLNYISRFIAQSTIICEPIFKMLRKDVETSWTKDCQRAFDQVKEYLSTPPVLIPPKYGSPLLLYLYVLDRDFGCVLGQHDKIGRKEQAICYLSKKFAPTKHGQKLRHYFCVYTTYLISRMDPLKYIVQKPMPIGKLAKWKILLREDIAEAYDGWRMFFDGAANFKGVGVRAVLVSEIGQHYPVQGEWDTKNTKILPYLYHVQELMKRFTKIEFKHVPRIQNEFVDTLATLASMIHHLDKNFIDPILVRIYSQPAYYGHVEEETGGNPWFHNIKEYLVKGEYPEQANHTQKRTLRRLSNHFFQRRGILHRRTPDLVLLRCVDAKEASKLLEEIHAGTCRPHMNNFVLAKKILIEGYFWMTMETDCIQYVQKYHQGQIHADMIRVPPNKLNATSTP